MPKRVKFQAIAAFVLALALYLFFDLSKHQSALAQVNAFAEDPHDAVGSFGVQFAFFTALLALIRAFRPYQMKTPGQIQLILLERCISLTWKAVAVVLVADTVATIRSYALWPGSTAGDTLTILLAGMLLLTAFLAWFSRSALPGERSQITWARWSIAAGIFCAYFALLAWYPQSWRQNISGGLLTALTGMILYFVAIWAWEYVSTPLLTATAFEDCIDDFASISHWLKSRVGLLKPLITGLERLRSRALVRWLNPRRHPWHGVLLLGLLMGFMLALAEIIGEGGADPHQPGRLLPIIAIFVGFECAGILLGYTLLKRPLGLVRRELPSKSEMALEDKHAP